jgi:branched-chain amino acid aminotransferase
MKGFVYMDGRMVPWKKARVSVLDYGLLYGYGVFETMRAYGGGVFRMEEHLKRLAGSCRELDLDCNALKPEHAVKKVLKANGLEDAYVRVTVTYGAGKMRLALCERKKPSLFAFAMRLPEGLEAKCRAGVRAGFSEIKHYSKNPLNRIKTTNYLLSALRKKEAQKKGLDDVIVLNEKNRVVEASTSNIFMVDENNTLTTPRIEDGCLPGITREVILDTAKKLGVKTAERTIKPGELLKARGVFITNSVMEIIPVVRIEGRKIKKGKLTGRLQREYRKLTKQP